MSISNTNDAKKYASIAEVAAAQCKNYTEEARKSPDYASEAKEASEVAIAASASAQTASQEASQSSLSASQSSSSALSSANSAASSAQSASASQLAAAASAASAQDSATIASNAVSKTVRSTDVNLSPLPVAAQRANKVISFDSTGNIQVVAPASGSAQDVLNQLAEPNGVNLVGGAASDTELANVQSSLQSNIDAINSNLSSTENGKGASLLGYKNTRWNGSSRNQQSVNLQVVSLKDFGAKLDGVTDDTAAIQAAIDALAYNTFINDTQIPRSNREYSAYVLDGGPGIALVSSPIQIYGGVGLRNITLRAATVNTFSAQAVLKSKSGTRMWGRFENITIDGNNQDCRGVFIENGVGAFWNNIIIVNTIRDAFTCTGGIFLSDFAFKCSSVDALAGGTKSLDATGLKVTGPDGYYSNGTIEFFPVGVYSEGGNNHFSKIHPWSGYYNNGLDTGSSGGLEMRIGFLVAGSNQTFSQCYADSPSKRDYALSNGTTINGIPNGGVGFYLSTGVWNCSFSECYTVINYTLYNACTDARVGLTNQISPWLVTDGRNNRFVNCAMTPGTATAPAQYSSTAVADATTVIGCERETNRIFSRVDGQDVLRVSTELGSVTKLIDFWGNGVNSGFIQQRDTNTLRHYANRSLELAVGGSTPLEVYAGSDGLQQTTLRPKVTAVTNLGDAGFRYITAYLTTNPNVSSDERLKSDIRDIPESLIQLAMETPIKRYVLNGTGKVHYGIVITEEWVSRLKDEDDFDIMGMLSGFDDADNPDSEHYGQYYGLSYADWQNILLEGLRRKVMH
ncbi:glycosyl hydrolase family 28-related protein [Enterobacter ludwigii]|uniref:glycosyl hydrolase family 28-related protein n=1 Tax=Enterobacter ludwigii TaxID=299767 RepID=UPI002FD3B421